MAAMNPEVMQAFSEIQKYTNEVQRLEFQLMQSKKKSKTADLNRSLIAQLGHDKKMFQGIGRMFIQVPQPDILKSLTSQYEDNASKTKELEGQKDKVQKSIDTKKQELQEIFKAQAEK